MMLSCLQPTSKMQHPSWRRCLRRGGLVHRPCASLHHFTFGAASAESAPPTWWLKGRPRNVFQSKAEVELLSQLAVLLMPDEPIAEAFRDFPVRKCKEWGSSRLSPDLTAYGVLKATDAALFIEYDGYYLVASLLQSCRAELVPELVSHLEARAPLQIDRYAINFAVDAELVSSAASSNRLAAQEFLQKDTQLTPVQVATSIASFPSVLGRRANLKPTVEWIKGLGLSESQVAKVILKRPQVLGYSIEANLKPTVDWVKGLGLSQSQVAKVIVGHPAVLGYSVDANLKPTVEWVKGLGLSQSQVAKVILQRPQVLGYSIEANLKPTVDWIKGLGLSQSQVTKVIATCPPVLGLSIEANLKPKVEWIKGLGLSQSQVAKVILKHPHVLGYSIEANLKPTVEWIKGLGLSQSQVAKVIATSPQVLGYSIEANLKPTVDWVRGLGLSQSQVAKLIATFPPVLGYSIQANFRVKFMLIQNFFPGGAAAELLARSPRLWSYRYSRLEHRLHVLKSQGQLSKLASAMTLGSDAFGRRFRAIAAPAEISMTACRVESSQSSAPSKWGWQKFRFRI
eukprot:s3089_g5.t1